MPEKTNKKNFVEIEFIGRDAATGEVFDTNIASEAKKLNPDANPKPLIVCIGEEMVIKGLDKALEDKELGRKYKIKIPPEEGYGKRNSQLIKLIPRARFAEHQMNPVSGMTIAIDSALAKIISASGGRVMVDFNNPLAGKELEYEFTIKRKIMGLKEKVDAIQTAFFRQVFPYEIDEKNKKIVFKDLQLLTILDMFRDRFKDMLDYDIEIMAKPAEPSKTPTEKPKNPKQN